MNRLEKVRKPTNNVIRILIPEAKALSNILL